MNVCGWPNCANAVGVVVGPKLGEVLGIAVGPIGDGPGIAVVQLAFGGPKSSVGRGRWGWSQIGRARRRCGRSVLGDDLGPAVVQSGVAVGPIARTPSALLSCGGSKPQCLPRGAFGTGAVVILTIVEGDALREGVAMDAEDDRCF